MGSTTVMHFTDRVFLGNYSVDAIAAAMPAGAASFLFVSFFMGVATYVNVFIAQYVGSGAQERVGASLWQ
ncbi:MAG: MATE family efflux transporter, partial [Deltaproteobacteria bacterium]|nr:MATE family efflux transporter [Deltaproteobacteria bacterium]